MVVATVVVPRIVTAAIFGPMHASKASARRGLPTYGHAGALKIGPDNIRDHPLGGEPLGG